MEHLTFDSRRWSPGDGFEAYDALYRIGADVTRAPDHFHATIAARRYPRLLIFDRTLSGVGHERTSKRAGSDGFEHATVQLVLSGRIGVTVGDKRTWVCAGEMVAFDMRRPQHTWTDGARTITVSIARGLFDSALPAAADFHGRVFASAAEPIVRENIRLLAGCDGVAEPTEVVAASMGEMLGTMLSAGVSPSRGAAAGAIGRRRAMRFIRANLAHVDLTAETIAERIGVSRSVLYRMFEAGGGVAGSIKCERLRAMRKALSSQSETRSISSISGACGFTSNAHACRSFREEFGTTPGRYRVMRRGEEADGVLSRWFDDFG